MNPPAVVVRTPDSLNWPCRHRAPKPGGPLAYILITQTISTSTRGPYLQRGASNVHFPAVASAISIPPVSEPLLLILDEHWTVLKSIPSSALRDALSGLAKQHGVPVESLIDAHGQKTGVESGGPYTDTMSRVDEYLALSTSREDEDSIGGYTPQFLNRVHHAPPELSYWFDLVGAVTRLREVRALVAFSRIVPRPTGADRIQEEIL